MYHKLSDAGMVRFTVKSYATVIAFVLNDGTEWKTAQRFSVTTSIHWGKLCPPAGYRQREAYVPESVSA
jgi:hypothetical protein